MTEINRERVMADLGLTEDEFIDMCILCGCDYASKIEGVGPVKAYKFIKEFSSIENSSIRIKLKRIADIII